jgi:putative acetyltransferase
MSLRPERASDLEPIRRIHLAAFAGHPHSLHDEQRIVDELRAAGALLVSLVAEEGGAPVGHVAFSPAWIDGQDRGWVLLGPVGVLPAWQRRGIGRALIEEGLRAAQARGAQGCVLVGDPAYYLRLGFEPGGPELRLDGLPPELLLRRSLGGPVPSGRVTYHAAFAGGR